MHRQMLCLKQFVLLHAVPLQLFAAILEHRICEWGYQFIGAHGYTSSCAKLVLLDHALYDVPVQLTVSLFWFLFLFSCVFSTGLLMSSLAFHRGY